MSNNDPDSYLHEKDAARLLGVSARTLQAWRCKKLGPPFVRLGRAIRYQRRTLVDWAEQQASSVNRA